MSVHAQLDKIACVAVWLILAKDITLAMRVGLKDAHIWPYFRVCG